MTTQFDFHSQKELDLLQMCHKDPEFTHKFIQNNHLFFDNISTKKIKNIPSALLLSRFPRSDKINNLVLLRGTIIKANPVLLKDVEQKYKCLNCDHSEILNLNQKKKKKICEECKKDNFVIEEVFNQAKSCQTIRIQDIGNPNTMTDTIEILITGDQSGKFFPGERIEVLGLVQLKWNNMKINEKLSPTIFIQAHTVKRQRKKENFTFCGLNDFENVSFFDKQVFLIKNFLNEFVANENIKIGLLLIPLFEKKKSKELRSNSHILLIGSSATGKSKLLKSASRLCHSICINGIGTSEAGLTTCAVKSGKEWVLEAGALILADNGLCCIDSFESLPLYEKKGLLEVMEQQTLSVAKAGMVSTLNARCSIIGTYNLPFYDKSKKIDENLKLSSPLISRFDLIFLIDNYNKNDHQISQKILNRENVPSKKVWTLPVLRDYIENIRNNEIKTNDGTLDWIELFFKFKKKQKKDIFTVRNLESILRLSNAHAKLLGKNVLDDESVFTVFFIIESSLFSSCSFEFDQKRVFLDEEYFVRKMGEFQQVLIQSGSVKK